MTTALPKQPTISSILLGIALVILAFLAFLRLPDVVKYAGTALIFVPAQLGLVDMVMPEDVMPLPLERNPTTITVPSPGQYLLYLNNYELLVIHDAVVAGHSKPWLKIGSEQLGTEIQLTLIGRGLAWYDTPFAAGRPVVAFQIDRPGTYQVVHPTRLDTAYIVPDTITGRESLLSFWALAELALIAGVTYYFFHKSTAASRRYRLNLRAQNRARAEANWKKIKKLAQEKQKEEDGPYWKKH